MSSLVHPYQSYLTKVYLQLHSPDSTTNDFGTLRFSAANSGSLHAFSPIRVAAFFQTNCSANRRGSSAAGTHTFDFQFSAKNDLLSIHALRQNERRLANLAGAWFFRIEIASNFNFAV